MRAQENSPITLTTTAANEKTNNNNSNSNNSICTQATCPNKGKIQTLRQRKSELEKLLDEKNLLLQQIQRQEAQIIGNECLSSSTGNGSGSFHNDNHQYISQQQQNTSTLRRKVGSSFKLPRINKKETNTEIENLLLEKKLQQEICNASYKLANDLTLSKSVRRNQKAEYEAAQQKLSVINQNLSVLKKRQLRSHSTSFSEGSPTHITPNNNPSINTLIGGVGGNNVCMPSSINLKSPPQLPQSTSSNVQIPSSQQSLISGGVLTTNLGNNFNINSNNTECSILMPSKKNQHNLNTTNTINSGYILNSNVSGAKSNSNNSNTSRYNTSNNYSPNDRRNSIKSAILSSSSSSTTTKHDNSSSSISSSGGLIQHFDRTLKNHRSDYDINRIVPSSTSHHLIDKYQFVNGLNIDNRISGSYSIGMRGEKDINYTNTSNYCNTFPLQQLNHQRIHHDNFIIDSDSKQQQQQHHHHQQQIVTENNNGDCENEFEIINNHNRTSVNFEKSSPLLSSPHQKDGRFNGQQQQQQQQQQLQYPMYDNESTTNLNYLPYSSRNSAITLANEYLPTSTSSIGGFNDWKQQNKRYENFDTVSLYPAVSSSTNQQQQSGLGGFWRTLPNNERVWHSTADDNLNIRKLTLPTTPLQNKTQQILPSSCVSDDILTTTQLAKDEISDKISISSMNSETNKKSREKQWLETSLDTPITHSKHSTTLGNQQQQQQQQQDQEQRINSHHLQYIPPHHHHHHHHHGGDGNNSIFYPPLPPPQPSVSSSLTLPIPMSSSATGQCNLNTISNYNKILNNNNNNYKERSKLSSQSMSNKIYQRSTIQQRLEDQSRLSHSTSVLNKQYIDGHHLHNHQQQKKQLENQNVNTTTIPTIIMSPTHDTNILYYHNNEIYNETSQQIRQTQLSSQPNFLHHHHHHQSPPPPPLLITSNKGTINSTNESTSSYYPSPPSPHHHHHQNTNNTNNNNNNLYRNIGAASVLMSNMSKAQDIRVESPKNMTVIQKAVFVPYKEVTKPFEMSDFYKYSTKFRQKDQQQQQNNTISSSTMQLQSQQQQQFSNSTTANLIHATNNNNNNNNNNNSNNCDTRNTTVNVVEEVK